MYVARFEAGSERYCTLAIAATAAASQRAAWADLLEAHPAVDAALRVSHAADERRCIVLLTADERAQSELLACGAALLERLDPNRVSVPADAAGFDRVAGAIPGHQLRVNHDGFHHEGLPLACEFRLYAAELPVDTPAWYQVNLRHHRPTPEVERRLLKALAWLDLERPFSDAVREMQRALIRRLRQPGWIADEYLAFADPQALRSVRMAIERQFAATAGRVGFSEAPLEAGDFSDSMVIGWHSLRDNADTASLAVLGARAFDAGELDWLLAAALAGGMSLREPAGGRRGTPQVFISYASSDFARAAQICAALEAQGIDCWIAPRDIERDLLPYTEAITRSLAQVRAVVVVLSEMANLSVHVPRELDLALERKLPIVPVRIANVAPAGQLIYLLRTCQWLNAFDRDWGSVVAELTGRLGQVA